MRLMKMARIITTLGRAHSDEIGFGLRVSNKQAAEDKYNWVDYVDHQCTTDGKVEIVIANRVEGHRGSCRRWSGGSGAPIATCSPSCTSARSNPS